MYSGPFRALAALLALTFAITLAAGCGGGSSDDEDAAGAERPNLIVVMTDDQVTESFSPEVMPYTWELFHDERSAIFQNAMAAPPLCCPARAGFITGQYPHNHGVEGNVPGYPELREKENVLPAWLARAGYRSTFIGKYLNGYTSDEPAPGWTSWRSIVGYPAYYDYAMDDNGEVTEYGSEPEDYVTAQMADRAVEEIADPRRDEPLFMWVALNAPHVDSSKVPPCEGGVPTPPTRAAYEEFSDAPLPDDPSYDEADRSDKPRNVAERGALKPKEEREITLKWRCGLGTLPAVDEGMERIVAALEDADELERTVLVYVSDNGYFFGEHAIGGDKRLAYEPSAHVPMAIRVGTEVAGEPPPPEIERMAATVDLAPTLLDYASAKPCLKGGDCRAPDGRSLRPLLEDREGDYPRDRAILLELDEADVDSYVFQALRTRRYLYSRMHRDRRGALPRPAIELYDLAEDPYELDNLWALDRQSVADLGARLETRLDRLASCAGSEERLFKGATGRADCE